MDDLKQEVDTLRDQKARISERKRNASEKIKEIDKKLEELGVKPDMIKSRIKKLQVKLNDKTSTLTSMVKECNELVKKYT